MSTRQTPAARPQWRLLYEVAAAQEGYFTTAQAAVAGHSRQLLRKHLGAHCRAEVVGQAERNRAEAATHIERGPARGARQQHVPVGEPQVAEPRPEEGRARRGILECGSPTVPAALDYELLDLRGGHIGPGARRRQRAGHLLDDDLHGSWYG